MRENWISTSAKTKTQISCAATSQLISAFLFATQIVQSLYFPNPKFQATSYLQWLYSPVCVRPGQKPRKPALSHKAHMSLVMRKPDFRIYENKDADQLCGNREADQRLCFRYTAQFVSDLVRNPENQLSLTRLIIEPRYEKTGFSHMRKQRRRSALR